MGYTLSALASVPLVVLVDLLLLRTRLLRRRVFWASYALVLFFQLIANGILTGFDVVRYDPGAILGLRVAWAPVEDLLFGFSLVTLTLSWWVWLGRVRRWAPSPGAPHGTGPRPPARARVPRRGRGAAGRP